MEECPIFQC